MCSQDVSTCLLRSEPTTYLEDYVTTDYTLYEMLGDSILPRRMIFPITGITYFHSYYSFSCLGLDRHVYEISSIFHVPQYPNYPNPLSLNPPNPQSPNPRIPQSLIHQSPIPPIPYSLIPNHPISQAPLHIPHSPFPNHQIPFPKGPVVHS